MSSTQTEIRKEVSSDELFKLWQSLPLEGTPPNWDEPDKIQRIALAYLVPKNYRKQYPDIESHAASIERGQLEPVKIIRMPNGRGRVWSGHRRCLAKLLVYLWAKAASVDTPLPTIECRVVIEEMDELDERIGAMDHNSERRDANPIEDAEEFKSLMETFNLSAEELARKMGGTRGYRGKLLLIERRLQLLALSVRSDGPDYIDLQASLLGGSLGIGEAEELAKVDKNHQQRLAKLIFSGNMSLPRLKEEVRVILGQRVTRRLNVEEMPVPANGNGHAPPGYLAGTSLGKFGARQDHGENESEETPVHRQYRLSAGSSEFICSLEVRSGACSLKVDGPVSEGMLGDLLKALGNHVSKSQT